MLSAISMLGGLALFLYGMRLMGSGLKKNMNSSFQKVLEKVTNNPFKSFLLGLLITALIQSSNATIVLTAGLVGAGVMTFRQSIGIVLGASVGTTVTGQIIRLMDLNDAGGAMWMNFLKPATLAPLAAIIGIILVMFVKSKGSNVIGEIALGFGILFTGMINMTGAMEPLAEDPAFMRIFTGFTGQPVLGFIAGAVVAAIFQSASASVGMLQSLSAAGLLTFSTTYPILLGIFVGNAITTAVICSIGTSDEAKRTGFVTFLYNMFTTIVLFIGIIVIKSCGGCADLWDHVMTSGNIADANTLFKLISALMCVPLVGVLYNVTMRVVKTKTKGDNIILDAAIQKLDRKLYISPMVALNSAADVIKVMQRLATHNTKRAFEMLEKYDEDTVARMQEREKCIDSMADAVDEYLIHLSAHIDSEKNSDLLNLYLQSFSEVERIGDHAVNLAENAESLYSQKRSLSEQGKREMQVLCSALDEVMEMAAECFCGNDPEIAAKVEPLEETIDDLIDQIRKNHLARMRAGVCDNLIGITFTDILINAERISDQCANMAIYVMAMHNEELIHDHHTYIRNLHAGVNEAYNREYKNQKEKYMSMLSASED